MGMAAGFQSGIALGKAFREGQERRRLEGIRTAAPETSQGYTAAQGQELEAIAAAKDNEGRPFYNVQVDSSGNYSVIPNFTEAQTPRAGMDTDSQYGVASVDLQPTGLGRAGVVQQPIPFSQQRVTDFLGRRFEGELTPDRIEAMRSRAMAEGLSDPRQRQAALAEAIRAEREAEEAPLRLEALRTQVESGKIGLKKSGFELTAAERADADAQRMVDFNAWRSQNPQADFATMTAKAQELGMGVDQQFKIASNLTGIKEQEFKDSQMRIRDLVKNQGLDGLLKAHKESKDLDPNSHFEVIRGQGGKVSLNRVNTATGEIIQPNVFSGSEAETTAYLNKAAMDPATIIDFTMNLEKNKAAIAAQEAQTRASDATVGLRGAQAKQIRESADNANARADIVDKFEALTDEEKAGAKGQGLIKQFNLLNVKAGGTVPLGTTPKAATGPARELSDLDKENLRYYRDWVKDPKNAKLPQGQKDAFAAELGVTEFIKRGAAGPQAGIGSNPYAAPQQGVDTTRAPATAAPAAPAPAALTTENTKLLNRAGNTGYNVQLPDGTTRVMSISELNRVGYQFPGGTGLQRAWYEDLLPRR